MTIKVDTRVPAELHPNNIQALDGYTEEDAQYIAPALHAFELAYESIGKVHTAREAAKRNPEWNEAKQTIETQAFAERSEKNVLTKFDSAHAQLSKSIRAIDKQLSEPIETRASDSLASEIRAHIKGLKSDGERINFIRQAIMSGDHMTVSSALGAPAYLSGIGSDMKETLTRMYHEQSSPAAAKRLKVMQGAATLLETRGIMVVKEMQRAVGKSLAEVNQLRAAKNAAEASFSMPQV